MLREGLHDTESRLSSVQVGVLWLAHVMYHISLILNKSISPGARHSATACSSRFFYRNNSAT